METSSGKEKPRHLIKLKRLREWNDLLRRYVRAFMARSNERDRTEDQISDQVKVALRDPNAGVWFILCDGSPRGYIFANIHPTEYQSRCVVIQQMYVEPGMKFRPWKQLAKALLEFGRSSGVEDLYFLTRRDPNAFIRLLGDGWEIDCFILRRPKQNVPRGTNGSK